MDLLNHGDVSVRLSELERLVKDTPVPVKTGYVNNHIHTFYSFSPYSPAKAVWAAYSAGLTTAGIMDHDSVAGCREFLRAGDITGVATTIGAELRCGFSSTRLNGRRLNNPDQTGVAYVALHAIPHGKIDAVAAFFKPYAKERGKRNRAMVGRLNDISPLKLDYDKDVLPSSKAGEGGSVTERHILFAFAGKILEEDANPVDYLRKTFGVEVTGKLRGYLTDGGNPYIQYDLLGVLKSVLIDKIYIDASDEVPDAAEYIAMAKDVGGIAAYAYLGDVADSVTGDKKAQKFEDDYIEELFEELARLKFDAVTYMPSRNTAAQLKRVRELCSEYGFMQISGEDINSPRQSFVCEALKDPAFGNLVDSTWALIRHERGESVL